MKKLPHVALLIDTNSTYSCSWSLLLGINHYLRVNNYPWNVFLPMLVKEKAPVAWLKTWHGHGIIARIVNERIAEAVVNTGLPTVDISSAQLTDKVPWVESDNGAIGRQAAKHLLERGFKHFAFCGFDSLYWSCQRSDEFKRCVTEAGGDCITFASSVRYASRFLESESDLARLAKWLKELPKPVGLMACNDYRAWQVLKLCREQEIKVPDELAIVGVDNDRLFCELSALPLSSVIPNYRKIGYTAADLLNQLMGGASFEPKASQPIKPLGVATRMSTDVFAVDDQEISQAVRYIREHACEGIQVDDVLTAVPLSRRGLEYRFIKLLKRTPHEEIVRVQMARVTDLMLQTELTLSEISDNAGFSNAEYMNRAFKKQFGIPPNQYRKQARG